MTQVLFSQVWLEIYFSKSSQVFYLLNLNERGGSEGMAAMSWPPCDVITRKRNERLLREISFSCPFSSLTNFIFSIFTRSENHIRWATRRNEEKKYWSFKTQKAFKTFSHHRIDLWKVKVEVLLYRVVRPLATSVPLTFHITSDITSLF